jgi:hypothetical protein
MTKQEFRAAFDLAHNDLLDWSQVDDSIVFGCGLGNFPKTNVTLLVVAKFIRWQCLYIFTKGNERWDSFELDQCAQIAHRKFVLVEDFKEAIHRAALVGGATRG